jgi:hypothetical protein
MSYATRARTGVVGVFVSRAAALPPAGAATDDLFSVTGEVVITGFFGRVTVAIPNESLDYQLDFDPDDGGADVALATALALDNTAVGTWLVLNETTGGVLVADLDVSDNVLLAAPLAVSDGDIKITEAGGGGALGTTARVEWGLTYIPVSADGAVVAV